MTVRIMAKVTAMVEMRSDPGVMYTRKKEARPSRTDMRVAAW